MHSNVLSPLKPEDRIESGQPYNTTLVLVVLLTFVFLLIHVPWRGEAARQKTNLFLHHH